MTDRQGRSITPLEEALHKSLRRSVKVVGKAVPVCPMCGGSKTFVGHPTKVKPPCPACQGTGKRPPTGETE